MYFIMLNFYYNSYFRNLNFHLNLGDGSILFFFPLSGLIYDYGNKLASQVLLYIYIYLVRNNRLVKKRNFENKVENMLMYITKSSF